MRELLEETIQNQPQNDDVLHGRVSVENAEQIVSEMIIV